MYGFFFLHAKKEKKEPEKKRASCTQRPAVELDLQLAPRLRAQELEAIDDETEELKLWESTFSLVQPAAEADRCDVPFRRSSEQ